MNTFALTAFFACLAATNAGYIGHANIIQGPSSKTTLVGPEGSVISAVAPGGQILHEENPGYIAQAAPIATYAAHTPVVAHAAPVVAHSPVAYAAPIAVGHETRISKYGTQITHRAPHVYTETYSAPVAYAAPVVGHGAVVAHHGLPDAVVAGPSGTIATNSLVAPYHAGIYGGHHHYGGHGGHHGLYL